MQISKTELSSTKIKLTISATETEVEPIKRHVLSHFAKATKIAGFRAGKAPASILEKNVDQRAMADEFLEHAMSDLYRRAIDGQKLRPASQPKVELKKFVPYSTLEFEVEVEVIGNISLSDYKKIKLAKPPVLITADDVKKVLSNLLQRSAERVEVQRQAKTGDEVTIDFDGRDDKQQPIKGADGKDYPLLLGSSTFIPGFEEHIVGTKIAEVKKFTIPFPADYGVKALQGKKVTFDVVIKKVSELKIAKLDDQFAVQAGPFKKLSELKADIKKQLKTEQETKILRDYQDELVRNITAGSSADIPKSMIDGQIIGMEEEEKRNLTYRGQTWQEHLKEEGINEEQHRERQRPQAEERVKAGLILSEIAQLESLEVTDSEIDERLEALKTQYKDGAMQDELAKPEARDDIAGRLLAEKTIARLVEYSSGSKK